MSPEELIHVVRHMFYTALELAAPFLLLSLLVGLLISLLQSASQLQEITLSFVPKMLVVAAALCILFPWMLKILTKFTHSLLICKWDKVVQYVS